MIFRPDMARLITAGRKTMTRRPVKMRGHGPLRVPVEDVCRYRAGKSYAVQPGRGQSATCRIAVLDVRRELAGEIAFADARQEGFATTDDFKAAWVAIHEKAWLEHEHGMLDEAENDDGVVLDRDVWILRRSLHMFDLNHASRPVWVIRFALDHTEEVRFLGASSPLVDGGKARLLSARKVKPRPATVVAPAMSENEASGYVTSPVRALGHEPEPVDRETQKRITADAGRTSREWQATEQAGRDRDRAMLSREDQVVRLRRAARLRSIDASRELWALENMLKTSQDENFTRKVRKAEARVFGVAA